MIADDLLGRTLGDFVVRARIGEGAQGIVYRAEQAALGREAVIKILRGQGEITSRFLREARIASRLDHPYAAHVYAFGAEPDGILWIAMELVRGTPLDKILAAQGPMPLERFVPFFERLCEVVHTAHEQGIVHRDLKPANVMVVSRAGRVLPKLLDLGIAKVGPNVEDVAVTTAAPTGADPALTQRGQLVGSPRYMAPEQWVNAPTIDGRTDIYALGIFAYEALVGEAPFQGVTMQKLARAHAKQAVPPLGDRFPPGLYDALARAMAKKQADRYATALDFAAAVRAGAGLDAEREALPTLDEETRATALTDLPYPIAEAVATLDAARHAHQARDAVWEIASAICLYVGTLALACRSRLAQRPEPELLLGATRHVIGDLEWLALARDLCRPFSAQRELFPIPELVGFVLEGATELEALAGMDRAGSFSEEQLRPILVQQLAALRRILRALGWLADYAVVTMTATVATAWMGTRRRHAGDARVAEGEVALLDADQRPILRLSPLVQVHEPSPGTPAELFFFAGKGRRGARFVAPPRGFERTDETFWGWFRSALFLDASGESVAAVDAAPYRGLASFSRDDAALFFGREAETEAFLNRLRVTPLLAVVGPSGAGKSSFVEAGVIPSLEVPALSLRPGATPLATLSARLATRRAGPGVLVVDQFEELFTLCGDPAERQAFAAELVRLAGDELRIIITLRDDFLIRATELGPLRARIGHGVQLLGTPAREDLLRILTLPAERAGYRFDEADLPLKMVEAVAGQAGALALLSFTAQRLWELRDRHFKQLTRKAHDALGGVAGALAQHAEAVREALPPDEQRLLRDAFRALVTAEGTRAVLTRTELREILGSGPAAERVIDHLIDARLLVTTETEAGPTVEVIHEALLSAWPRLLEWRREDADGARLRDQVRAAARQWDDRGRAAGLLWRDEALREYERWRGRYAGQVTAVEQAFGDASIAEARRARRNRRLLLAGIFTALSVALVIALFLNRRAAEARADAEQKTVRLLEDQGRQYMLASDPVRAYPYLAAAYERGGPTPALGYLLGRANRMVDMQLAVMRHEGFVWAIELDPTDRFLATASEDGLVRVWSVPEGKLVHALAGHGCPVVTLAISPDGSTVATGDKRGGVRLWDLRSGAERGAFSHHTGEVTAVVWSQDGQRLASASVDGSVAWRRLGRDDHEILTAAGEIVAVAFLHDDRSLLLAARDEGIVEVDLTTRARSHWPTFGQKTYALVRSGDGTRFVAHLDDRLAVYDARAGILAGDFRGFEHNLVHGILSHDGSRLLALATGPPPVLAGFGDERWVIPLGGHASAVLKGAFSRDGAKLATGSTDGMIHVRDTRTGVPTATLLGHTDRVRHLTFSRDGQLLVSAGFDATARLWRPHQADVVETIFAHQSAVVALAYDRSQRTLLSMGYDGTVRFWRVDGWRPDGQRALGALPSGVALSPSGERGALTLGRELLVVNHAGQEPLPRWSHGVELRSVAFGGDDEVVLVGDSGGDVHERRLAVARTVRRWHAHDQPVVAIVHADDGSDRWATVGTGDAAVWSRTGELQARFGRASLALRGGAFDPGGHALLVIDNARSATTWNARLGSRTLSLVGHTDTVGAGTYASGGRLLVTAGYDNTARVWDAVSGTQLAVLTLDGNPSIAVAAGPGPDRVTVGRHDGHFVVFAVNQDAPRPAPDCRLPFELTAAFSVRQREACQ